MTDAMDHNQNDLEEAREGRETFTFRSRKPGDIGYIIYRHGVLYAQEYGFDETFDLYVGKPLIAFAEKFAPEMENLWIVEQGTKIVGSMAIVNTGNATAQLRWLLVEPEARGRNIGQTLVDKGVTFCRAKGYQTIFLWTIDYLAAAKKIYANAGFRKTDTKTSRAWGQDLTEERWEMQL
jgi:N-acetylglutamate synthase-like GNAT family acetyltransferase